jgi:hypothetical protein
VVGVPAVPGHALRSEDNDVATVTRQQPPHDGEGTAWLVADRAQGDFICLWYVGRSDDHVGERARVATADDAVAWGRARTSRVRIRTADGRSQWAGAAPRPDGLSGNWVSTAAGP